MNVSAINGSVSAPVPPKPPAQPSAVQEALETTAVTKQEASKGDQQAVRKLAKQQQQQTPPPSANPNVGNEVDKVG